VDIHPPHPVELGLSFPTLRAASWQTADRTGALAHIDYAEVKKYAELSASERFRKALE
jgi:hypothetical protein